MAALRHTIVTGQSLAAGGLSGTPVSTNPQGNARLHRLEADGDLVPLDTGSLQVPDRTLAERAQTGTYEFVVNTHSAGSTAYAGVKKGTATYAEALAYVQAGYTAAVGRGDTFDVRALHIIHGEQDEHGAATPRATYAADLDEWLADYNTDCKAVTGQVTNLKAILCQLTSGRVGDIAPAQLDAHRSNPAIWLATPKYHLPYADSLHLTAEGYYKLGEYHGKVHKQVVIDGGTWEPVAPLWIDYSGTTITVKMNVPAAPLVIDTTLMTAQTAYGFGAIDDTGTLTITNVSLVAPDIVSIIINRSLGANPVLKYGQPASGHGNLRDSDVATSALDGSRLYNWCCQFADPIPFGTPPVDTPPAASATRPVGRSAAIL